MLFARAYGLRKGMNILIRDFLGDESIEKPGGEFRIFRLVRNERSRGLDRQKVELFRSRSVEQSANRLAGDADRVHRPKPIAATRDGPHDFGYVGWVAVSCSV